MKHSLNPIGSLFLALVLTGCVSIDQNVAMDQIKAIEANQNPTQKCPVRPYPCNVISTQGASGALILQQGPRGANDQAGFDAVWTSLTVDSGQGSYITQEGSNKPRVDWSREQAFFLPVGIVTSSCHKIVPARVETDCLNITIYYSAWTEKGDCNTIQSQPVYVYIYPKTNLPVGVLTTDDADADGFSNESEIKVGTKPMDASSHP